MVCVLGIVVSAFAANMVDVDLVLAGKNHFLSILEDLCE